MSGSVSFKSAWEAEVHSRKKSPVYGFVAETLSSSMIKGAALGDFRKQLGFSSPDLIMAVGSSISLFSLDAPGMAIASICNAPVFTNILSVERLQPPLDSNRSFAETNTASQISDLCVVLEESGQLALLHVEEVDGQYRLRTLEKTEAFADLDSENMSQMLHKTVVDPLSRAVAVVSWINHIELLLTNWDSHRSAMQTRGSSPSSSAFHSRICIDTNGAICDAAILSPLRSELQRILLVAAVVEKSSRHVSLHLYESWVPGANHSPPLSLVAKLPLPYSMSTPMHIVPLPDHRESFLLINECEIAFVSAPQILSGDVNIYYQPIPRLANGQPDLVKSYCVAGTKAISASSSHMNEGRRQSESLVLSMNSAQKVYIATQSGALFCAQVSSRPYISLARVSAKQGSVSNPDSGLLFSSETMLFLGRYSHKRYRNADSAEPSPDYIFVSGDCADHRIVRVTEEDNDTWRESEHWSSHVSSAKSRDPAIYYSDSLAWSSRQVLVNQSPMSDFMMLPDANYWTNGVLTNGAVNRAQFGHGVRIEETISLASSEENNDTSVALTRLWAFELRSIALNEKKPCVVLQGAESLIPIIRDVDGEWQLMSMLQQQLVNKKQLLFVGSVGSYTNNDICYVVCVARESVFLIKSSVIAFTIPEPNMPVTIASARHNEVFTHGALLSITDDSADRKCSSWAVVALRTEQMRSLVRILPILVAETDDFEMDQGSAADSSIVEIGFAHEISCMRIVSTGRAHLLLVGTYEPRLFVYHLGSCLESKGHSIDARLLLAIDINEHMNGQDSHYQNCNTESANSLYGVVASDAYMLLSAADKQFLLIGLRNGSMIQAQVSGLSMKDDFSCKQSAVRVLHSELTVVGPVPVVFTDTTTLPSEQEPRHCKISNSGQAKSCLEIPSVLILSELLFLASLSPVGTVSITLCSLCDGLPLPEIKQVVPASSAWYQGKYAHMALFDNARNAIFCLVADTSGAVSLLSIDATPQCHVHEIPVGIEPRRIISDKETGLMLVAGIVPAFPLTTGLFPTSSLKAIDAKYGHIHAEVQLDSYELVHSLEMWHIKGQKSYRYICVGTGQYSEPNPSSQGFQINPRAVGGRLVIYNLKATKRKSRIKNEKSGRKQRQLSDIAIGGGTTSGYELRYVWESKRLAPVRALAHLGGSYLVLASGTLCVVLKLDVVQKQLIECCEVELRFPASSLDVHGNNIVVGSSRETVHLFRFVPPTEDDPNSVESIQMVHSARFGVDTADACCLTSDLVVGVDTSGYLYTVGIPEESR
ncbi:hypothetical protein FB639_002023, partial [Coemansia asiatica]